MAKKEKIIIEKKKKRVPVPQKPPKVEEDKKKYDRKKEKEKTRKDIKKLSGTNDLMQNLSLCKASGRSIMIMLYYHA